MVSAGRAVGLSGDGIAYRRRDACRYLAGMFCQPCRNDWIIRARSGQRHGFDHGLVGGPRNHFLRPRSYPKQNGSILAPSSNGVRS